MRSVYSIMGGLDRRSSSWLKTRAVRMGLQTCLTQKLVAINTHRSRSVKRIQAMNTSPEQRAFMQPMTPAETFALGGTRGLIPHWSLRDLLDGL